MGDVVTIEQLEHLLGVRISVDVDKNDLAGIHIAPGDQYEIELKVILTGAARR